MCACPCCCIGAHLDLLLPGSSLRYHVKFSSCLFHVCAQLYCFPLAVVLRLKAFAPRCIVKHQAIVHEHYNGVDMRLYTRLSLNEREREKEREIASFCLAYTTKDRDRDRDGSSLSALPTPECLPLPPPARPSCSAPVAALAVSDSHARCQRCSGWSRGHLAKWHTRPWRRTSWEAALAKNWAHRHKKKGVTRVQNRWQERIKVQESPPDLFEGSTSCFAF